MTAEELFGKHFNGIHYADITMETIVDESTAPVGESFSAPASKAAGLSVGNVAAGERYGIWLERVVNSSAVAVNGNSATINWEGDTTAT